MNIIFWHNIRSEHISPLVKALAERQDVNVYFGYEDPKQRGWKCPDFGQAPLLDVRQPENYHFLLTFQDKTDFHILSGYFSYPIAWKAFHQIRQTEAKILILSEAFEFIGPKGFLRLLKAKWLTARWGDSIDAVLAMGNLGTEFFRRAGFPNHKLYPFCYVIEVGNHATANEIKLRDNDKFQILFVGKLIPRKRVDLLLKAVSQLKNANIGLTIVGEGRSEKRLVALAQQLAISEQVTFLPKMTNEETIQLMGQSDLLVLPSRWDGWGAVVSEALSVGTPVICSDRCGAAFLIGDSEYGETFKFPLVEDLGSKLEIHVTKGKHTASQRSQLQKSSTRFQADSMKETLLCILGTL